MADWIQQYSAALEARDTREQAHRPYIDAYTALADRTAQLQHQEPTPSTPSSPAPQPKPSTSRDLKSASPNPKESPTDALTALRADLATTQKARASLQAQLATTSSQLTALSTSERSSRAQITLLSRQKLETERRLRDRDEELRGKSKMVEQAQDEMVALGLQLNLAEERSKALEEENRELVERWMRRMGEEADRVNRDSRWE